MHSQMKKFNDFHDAELHCLQHDLGSNTVQCSFRTPEGRNVTLIMRGVTNFRCTDFGLQNVAFELICTASQEVAKEDICKYAKWITSSTEADKLVAPKDLESEIDAILKNEKHCIFLIPSWGAQFGAIATKVEYI